MRPERLELHGFGAYREPTTIDFADAELFALCGATGAGKSTVVDAICFALYGSVPRLGDRRLVAPVVSQGRVEARVRLTFSVAGDRFCATRVVRSTGPGRATTREARLERLACVDVAGSEGDTSVESAATTAAEVQEVLAGSADELTAEVERLLGLRFDHFTTCVVLPQGDFMRFLHAKTSERAALLVELLDLGVFRRMRELASGRAGHAAGRRQALEEELAGLAHATPERLATLKRRLTVLQALLDRVDSAEERINELEDEVSSLRDAAGRDRELLGHLDALAAPDGLEDLASRASAAAQALGVANEAERGATADLDAARERLAGLPAKAELDAALAAHTELAELVERVEKGEEVTRRAREAQVEAEGRLEVARAEREAASAALEAARLHDAAAALAAEVRLGAPCPVCDQVVEVLPEHGPSVVSEAMRRLREAEKAMGRAEEAARKATREADTKAALLADLAGRASALRERLADSPGRDVLVERSSEVESATTAVTAAQGVLDAARSARVKAEQLSRSAESALEEVRQALHRARDSVAVARPPLPTDDPAADWRALLAWRDAVREEVAARLTATDAKLLAATERMESVSAEVFEACLREGVEPGEKPGRSVSEARAEAERQAGKLESGLARVEQLTSELAQARDAEAVAKALEGHLRANRFESWVLKAALRRLVDGATRILHSLSQGAYSLTLDGSDGFEVVDHLNADTRRSARTLSGGETFLASLALALALAEEVARLVAGSSSRIESIFLDEGFGTLDSDTLDTVASALEELQARGRMVGLISHVPELAERMPVCFEVSKSLAGATVVRVDR